MKKLKIVFILALCFVSFNTTRAESLIIPSTDTIDQYLEYRSGCSSSNILDCYRANSIENNAWSDVRSILNQIPRNTLDRRVEDIKKAREKLEKDNDKRYSDLQAKLKSISASIDTNIKNGFYCVYPTQTCTESTYQSIRGIAISSGLTPDANQLAQCRAQIDEYNAKLQEYNNCQNNFINKKVEDSSKAEYEYQLQVYKLKSDLACMDKEGNYSFFNTKTKECECEVGSTFINGECENELRLRLDKLLMCVQTFGPLAHYDYAKAGCVCEEGSEFDWNNNGLCTAKKQPLVENRYIPVAERQNTKKAITPVPEVKPTLGAKSPQETALKTEIVPEPPVVQSQDSQIPPASEKTTFWQRLKISISKFKFW